MEYSHADVVGTASFVHNNATAGGEDDMNMITLHGRTM